MISFARPRDAMTLRLFLVEIAKLRGSLAGLLTLAVPGAVLLLSIFVIARRESEAQTFLMSNSAVWVYAMLPLGITALSVVMAQMEHGSRGWDHLLALPGVRSRIFPVKAAIMLLTVALWHIVLLLGMIAVVAAFQAWVPGRIAGTPDYGAAALLLAKMFAASGLVCVIQLWVALWFRNFVIPLAVGIGGVFFAIGATSAEEGVYFPWLLPVNTLRTDPSQAQLALILGVIGGLIMLIPMQWAMRRRAW